MENNTTSQVFNIDELLNVVSEKTSLKKSKSIQTNTSFQSSTPKTKTSSKKSSPKKIVDKDEKIKDIQLKISAWNTLINLYPGNSCFKKVRDSLQLKLNKIQ